MSVEAYEAIGSGRGSPASAHRRDIAMKMREVRENLTSTSGLRPAFDLELARQFAQNRLSAGLPVLVMIATVTAASTLWTTPTALLIWLMTIIVAQAITVALCRRFLTEMAERVSTRTWVRRFAMAELISAVTWAGLAAQLWLSNAQPAQVFALFLMMLVVAMSTMLSATLPLVLYAGAFPISVTVIGLALANVEVRASAMALMGIGSVVYFVLLGGRLHRSSVETLEFRAEKDALIAELEQAKANSDEARRRAEEANLAKSRFLATMSHELRTPLNAILGFSEVMKSEVFGPLNVPTYKEYVGDIHDSGQHLLNLINEILDLSRIEAGRYELKEEAVQLVHVADECHHLLKLRAKAKGIAIHQAFEPNMPALWADERAVRQVVLNLLTNAIKFTPQGGEVTIKVGWTSTGGQYLLVRDTGPGIPEEEIPTVMGTFGRGSHAIKTAEQGTGLGLPIVKGLVELHGGRVTLTSRLREGTEVIVTFPAERVMEALAPIVGDERGSKRPAPRGSAWAA